MNLKMKKLLASKVLGVGKGRIIFANLSEIGEAITRQDIMDLHKSGAIKIKPAKGRLKITKRAWRRGIGKIKGRKNIRKRDYVIMTRKLRTTLRGLLQMNKISLENYRKTRKMIKAKNFRSKRHLLEGLKTE